MHFGFMFMGTLHKKNIKKKLKWWDSSYKLPENKRYQIFIYLKFTELAIQTICQTIWAGT